MKTHCVTLFLLFFCSTLFSQVYVKPDATGSNDGSSWDDAYTSLKEAVNEAPADATIWVAAGTYRAGESGDDPIETYFLVGKPLSIYGGFAGTEININERDVEANETILSADLNDDDIPNDFENNRTDNGYHVLFLDENSGGTLVDGFTIEGGNSKFGDPPNDAEITEWAGAGILAIPSCTVKNCFFRQNSGAIGAAMTSLEGEVISVENSRFEANNSTFGSLGMTDHQSAEVINCDFVENTASRFGGGATVGNSNVIFSGCNFTGNSSMSEGAGGLFIFQNNFSLFPEAQVTIENTEFVDNSAPFAGGLLMNNFAEGTSLDVVGCLFEGNAATHPDGMGGGLAIRNQSSGMGGATLTASVFDCEINENTAEHAAGALFFCQDFTFTLEIQGCEVLNNESNVSGGGMTIMSANNGRIFADLNTVEFRNNTNQVSGAGLQIDSGNDTYPINATLTDCIFEGNITTGLGGGLAANTNSTGFSLGPIVTIDNCSFVNNLADACCGGIWASSSKLTVSDSHFEDNSTRGDLAGGGAIGLMDNDATVIERTVFSKNSTMELSSAIYQSSGKRMVHLDNVIFNENIGDHVIYTEDSLSFRNVSLLANEGGIYTGGDDTYMQFQNTILADNGDNFDEDGDVEIISFGGNLSNDNSLEDYLEGSGGYDDQHGVSPMLDNDFVPNMGSPCVDRGNPEGIDASATDAAGAMRIQGDGIDIGAYESEFTLTDVNDLELAASVGVFPNPFSNELNIQSEILPEHIRLFDAQGRLVDVISNVNSKLSFQGDLPTGQYILEMIFEEGTVQKKVVKE